MFPIMSNIYQKKQALNFVKNVNPHIIVPTNHTKTLAIYPPSMITEAIIAKVFIQLAMNLNLYIIRPDVMLAILNKY